MNSTLRRFAPAAALAVLIGFGCKPADNPAPTAPGATNAAKASAPAKKPRIAFISNGVAPFWRICEAGVKAAGADLGAEVSMHMPSGGVVDQKRIIEDLVIRGVDGIAISPIDAANQAGFISDISKRVKLVTADSDAPASERLAYVGMDNYKAGRLGGQLVKEALPKGGTLMIFIGRLEQDNAHGRRQGLIDELLGRGFDPTRNDPPDAKPEGNGFKILGTLTDQFDLTKGKANVEDTLSKYPDIDAMVGLFAYNPPLILQALDQAGKLNKVKVIAFDEADETLAGIEKGTVTGTVVQNPYMYGYKAVEVLVAALKGDTSGIPENKFFDFPGRIIRQDNLKPFWDDLKAKMGREK